MKLFGKNKRILILATVLLFVTTFFSGSLVGERYVYSQGVNVTCTPPQVPQNGLCVDPNNPEDTATPGQVVNTNADSGWGIGKALQWAIGVSLMPAFGTIGILLMSISAMILGLAGATFNFAISWSVVEMASYVNDMQEAIDVGWGLFRDVVNMFLIFILLYISIRMILGGGGLNINKTIKNVIIVALFINFSMLLTKVVIDASNVLAVGIYDNIMNSENIGGYGSITTGDGETPDGNTRNFVVENTGLSGALMRPILLTMIFDPDITKKESLAGSLFNPTNMGNLAAGAAVTAISDPSKIIVVGIVGSIMMIITAFIFFAGATMFITRLGVLIILMVVSPLAFASMAFPGLEKNWDKWLQMLIKNSFFAPAYLFLIYFVAFFMNNEKFISTTTKFGIIMNFMLAMVMMLTALVVANQMGAVGGKFASAWAGKLSFGLAGWASRQTIGRGGKMIADSKGVQEWATSNDSALKRVVGRSLVYGGDKLTTSSLDMRNLAPVKNMASTMKVDFGKAQTKGFEALSKESAENMAKYSKRYGIDKDAEKKAEDDIKAAEELLKTQAANLSETEKNLKKVRDEIAAADEGAWIPDYDLLKKKADELEEKKKNLERSKSETENRKNEAAAEKLRANRRMLYANSIERDTLPFRKGTKKEAAKKIREELGKGKKDKAWEDILKMVKEAEGGEKKEEDKGEEEKK